MKIRFSSTLSDLVVRLLFIVSCSFFQYNCNLCCIAHLWMLVRTFCWAIWLENGDHKVTCIRLIFNHWLNTKSLHFQFLYCLVTYCLLNIIYVSIFGWIWFYEDHYHYVFLDNLGTTVDVHQQSKDFQRMNFSPDYQTFAGSIQFNNIQ